jgi:hypothetical protein
VFHFSIGLLVWFCKKHKVVSLSTIKDEYRGIINPGTKEVFIHQILGELGFPVQASTDVYCDNQSVVQIANNLISHSKMKRVELHVYYLIQLVQEYVSLLFTIK